MWQNCIKFLGSSFSSPLRSFGGLTNPTIPETYKLLQMRLSDSIGSSASEASRLPVNPTGKSTAKSTILFHYMHIFLESTAKSKKNLS